MRNKGEGVGHLIALFVTLSIADALTTYVVVGTGEASEGNPVFLFLSEIEPVPAAWFMMLLFKVAMVCGVAIWAYERPEQWKTGLYVLNAWFLAVVLHNILMYASIA